MILEHIWDSNENLWANVVDVHIKHLRDKIDRPFGSDLIRTVHGVGYKLVFDGSQSKKLIVQKY
jgi:two-component system OmpR family response regulator